MKPHGICPREQAVAAVQARLHSTGFEMDADATEGSRRAALLVRCWIEKPR
ncbi:MAG: hypothetical protein Q8Q09_14110 [Deltaproteobacteria bacterium]|nr:hypothetical protein [Deltaproteobacteria bacterium]